MNFRDYLKEEQLFKFRAGIAFFIVSLCFAILIVNLFRLQIEKNDEYSVRSQENYIRVIPIPPVRGMIYDRNGIPLVENVKSFNLEIMPYKINNINETINAVLTLVGVDKIEIEKVIKGVHFANRFKPFTIKHDLTEIQSAKFYINQFKFPGISISVTRYRKYPYSSGLSPVLGFVSKINQNDLIKIDKAGQRENYLADHDMGKQGIEEYYENMMHGRSGYKEAEVDNHGRIIRILKKVNPQAGMNLYLTIDLELQQYIEKLLLGQKAAMLVEDPNDGSIIAMVSSPSYDPNPFVKGIGVSQYRNLLNDEDRPLINRVTQGLYPPASTVKPYIAFSALYSNIIKPDTSFFGAATWTLPGTERHYRDWKKTGHGTLNYKNAIEESADTFFYQVAYMMGIDKFHEMLSKFGYGKLSGIDIHEEYAGLLPSRKWKKKVHRQAWFQGDTVSVGIGQGYWLATPIQMAKALITLINNGRLVSPHLLLKTQQGKYQNNYQAPDADNYIADKKSVYWNMVRDAMWGMANATNGTGYKYFHTAPYGIAAKTGTSQVFSLRQNQVYNAHMIPLKLRDHIFYTAYAPYKKPKYAVVLILENGGRNGIMGASVVRSVLDHLLISPENDYKAGIVEKPENSMSLHDG